VSAENAEKPYYVIARLKAAENAGDTATRARLLKGAVASDPSPIEPRLKLFSAYMQANRFDNALAVFRGQAPQEEVPDRAAIVRDIAVAHRKSGHLEQARQFYRMLGNLDSGQDVKAELASIEAELQRLQQNQRRMPHVHDNLDQTQRVRPRV
jgi:thioredoxin-like negative regulator of GroEL